MIRPSHSDGGETPWPRLAGLAPVAQLDRASVYGTEGREFESLRARSKCRVRRVQEWMGHADTQTTMRNLHYAPRKEDIFQVFSFRDGMIIHVTAYLDRRGALIAVGPEG
jgi:hypothetical protein